MATCDISWTIVDRESPTFIGCDPAAPTIINTVCDPDKSTAVLNSGLRINATDNSGIVTVTSASFPVANLTGGSAFPFGTTTVLFTATDPFGRPAFCTSIINVLDTQPPLILDFPGGNSSTTFLYSLTTDPGMPSANLTLPGMSAWDNVGLARVGFETAPFTPASTFAFLKGTTSLTFSALDTSRNLASVTILIVVTDDQPPIFVDCPTELNSNTTFVFERNNTAGLPSAPVDWPTISARDNVDGPHLPLQIFSNPVGLTDGSAFPIGTSTIQYVATDTSGNQAQCEFLVRVTDAEPPTLLCPNSIIVVLGQSDNWTLVSWRLPFAADNNFISRVFATQDSPQPRTGVNLTAGLYNVTYVASDSSDNNNTCTFSIDIQPAPLQVATVPQTSASTSNPTTAAAAGGAGGVAIIAIVALFIVYRAHQRAKKRVSAAQAGYAELLAMSDEFILERARAIQETLMEQRQAEPPMAVQRQVIHPDRKFAPPPSGVAELEAYMREVVCKEIDRGDLEFGSELGAGEFGTVCEGYYIRPEPKLKVAIKMLRKSNSEDNKARFLKEAAIMAQFNHPNIVSLTGVCTLPADEPTLIVLEYMHLGSLHGYLQSPMVKEQLATLTMIRMALDVGAAMQYLAESGFVHRDLAARNVLLDKTMTCRVGDFGLSVDLAEKDEDDNGFYAGTEGGKIPVRWTAIEAICFRQFSSASDVWSYGVLLWEIWSYAEMPYKGWTNKKVTEQVSQGYRLGRPDSCPDLVFEVMVKCWTKNVKRRITFAKIMEAMVEAWKEEAFEKHGGGGEGDGLYENNGTKAAGIDSDDEDGGNGAALYDTGLEDESAPAEGKKVQARGSQLYDAADDVVPTDTPRGGGRGGKGPAAKLGARSAAPSSPGSQLYDTADTFGYNAAFDPTTAEGRAKTRRGNISAADVGSRVVVPNRGSGVLRYVGLDVGSSKAGRGMFGVELDEPNGEHNGQVNGVRYFTCKDKHGVLLDHGSVFLTQRNPALLANAIYASDAVSPSLVYDDGNRTPGRPNPYSPGHVSQGYAEVVPDDLLSASERSACPIPHECGYLEMTADDD